MYTEWDGLEDGRSLRIDDQDKLQVLSSLRSLDATKETFFDQSLRYAEASYVTLADRELLARCGELMMGSFVQYSVAVYHAEPLIEERIYNLQLLVMNHEEEIRQKLLGITEDPFFRPMSKKTEQEYDGLFYGSDMTECPDELLGLAHKKLATNFSTLFCYFIGTTTRELDY